MYLLKRFSALSGIAIAAASTTVEPATTTLEPVTTMAVAGRDFTLELAHLLSHDEKPSVAAIDALTKRLYLSTDYNEVTRVGRLGGVEFVELVGSIDEPVAGSRLPQMAKMRGAAAREPLSDDMIEMTVAGTHISSQPKSSAAPAPPSQSALQAITYIATTIDAIHHLILVVDRTSAAINAENYVVLIQEFNEDLGPMLAQLANEAADKLFVSDGSAARWKEAVWQTHLLVANYASEKKGFEEWTDFKARIVLSLTRLVDFAIVAKDSVPVEVPAGASNEVLQAQLVDTAIETGGMCLWKCLFSCCTESSVRVSVTPAPVTTPVPGEFAPVAPSGASRKAIELVLFIDSTVAAIRGIIDEVRALDASGPDGDKRLMNLKLRIALRVTNLVKQALANDALGKLFDKIKSRSVLLMGTMSGVGSAGSWEAIKDTVSEVLAAITQDLEASKPTGVI